MGLAGSCLIVPGVPLQWAFWVGGVLEYVIAVDSHEALVPFASSVSVFWGVPAGSGCKGSAGSAGDPGAVSGSGRSPGEGNDCPLQCSCLENSVDRGAWRATVHGGHKESYRTEAT